MKFLVRLLWLQGIYYLITGVWPLVHLPSFLWVTGPKSDIWLVKTVGALITVIAASLITAALRREYQPALGVLAIGSALCLFIVDVYYTLTGVIATIYLLDAGAEIIIIGAWIGCLIHYKKSV